MQDWNQVKMEIKRMVGEMKGNAIRVQAIERDIDKVITWGETGIEYKAEGLIFDKRGQEHSSDILRCLLAMVVEDAGDSERNTAAKEAILAFFKDKEAERLPAADDVNPATDLSFMNVSGHEENHGHHHVVRITSRPIFSGKACDFPMVKLPIYDQQETLLQLSELPASAGIRPAKAQVMQHFTVPAKYRPGLDYRSEKKPLPRYEVQLRVFQLDTTSAQSDAFPPNCVIKLDQYNVFLPDLIPNQGNAEQKRISEPINLTTYCYPLRDSPYNITIEWSCDNRAWVFGIFLVVHQPATSSASSSTVLGNVFDTLKNFKFGKSPATKG